MTFRRYFLLLFLLIFPSCILRNCASSQEGMPYPFASNLGATSTRPGLHEPATPPGPLPDNFEDAKLETVLPNSSNTFDPFTYGRPGSPFGPGKIFSPGVGSQRCGPIELPMSPQFADPGDTQAVLLVFADGLECQADIDHDKPGAAITFPLVGGRFTNSPWRITSQTPTTVTITNGNVTLRLTYRTTSSVTTISQVEYL